MRIALNQAEAAASLGISVNTFKQHVRPHIKRVDLGDRMLFPVTELQKWVDSRATSP